MRPDDDGVPRKRKRKLARPKQKRGAPSWEVAPRCQLGGYRLGKVSYASPAKARQFAERNVSGHGGDRQRPYLCDCGAWHLTSKPRL